MKSGLRAGLSGGLPFTYMCTGPFAYTCTAFRVHVYWTCTCTAFRVHAYWTLIAGVQGAASRWTHPGHTSLAGDGGAWWPASRIDRFRRAATATFHRPPGDAWPRREGEAASWRHGAGAAATRPRTADRSLPQRCGRAVTAHPPTRIPESRLVAAPPPRGPPAAPPPSCARLAL